jgi:hypothetical protein
MVRLMSLYGYALRVAVSVCPILLLYSSYMMGDTSSVSVQTQAVHG